MKIRSALFVVVAALPVGAQSSAAPPRASGPDASAVGVAHELWQTSSGYVLAAAEQMPEARYSYKPSADVRTFGEVVLHVASAHQLLCGIVLGEKEKDLGKPTAKADVVAALKASMRYCDRAYAISDAQAMTPASVFDQPRTQLYALMANAWHDNEHYGNIVTYMRLQGMVPPSSQPKK
jgi:uncharacterized damage-inducible protein DinB